MQNILNADFLPALEVYVVYPIFSGTSLGGKLAHPSVSQCAPVSRKLLDCFRGLTFFSGKNT